MAIQLKVRPDELQKAASEIQNETRDVETAFRSLGEAITSSRSYWEGDASEAHQKFYDSFKEDIETIVRRLKEHPRDLLEMAGIYVETEESAVQAAESLVQDVIV